MFYRIQTSLRRAFYGKVKSTRQAKNRNPSPALTPLAVCGVLIITGAILYFSLYGYGSQRPAQNLDLYSTGGHSDLEQGDEDLVEELVEEFTFTPVLIEESDRQKIHYEDDGMNLAYYNVTRSMEIGAFREPYDKRHEQCKKINYPLSSFEPVSIIIPFRNEPLVTMLRTLNTLFESTEDFLLNEVILVHDGSNTGHKFIGSDMLDKYLPMFGPKLKYIDIKDKVGLVGGRMKGFQHAISNVFVVLDIHIELGVGWLPPLLDYLQKHPKGMAVPQYDTIDLKTFNIYGHALQTKGSLSLHDVTFDEQDIRMGDLTSSTSDRAAPIRHSVACGGLYAINKAWIEEIDYYDTEMAGWGFENIENSLRIWRCGGEIHMVPCSHMAHVYRDTNPNVAKSDEWAIFFRNKRRLIEAWFEDYSMFVKSKDHKKKKREDYSKIRVVQNRLQCKSMEWYMNNIQPCNALKIRFDLMRIESPHRSCEDDMQKGEIGEFDTAMQCSNHIKEDPSRCDSGYFMHSTNKEWGCRCCVTKEGNKDHVAWNIYNINDMERPKTEKEKRAHRLVREERVGGECQKSKWTTEAEKTADM